MNPKPLHRRLRGALAAIAVLGTTLTGCGTAGPLGESLVGLHDAPAERSGAAIAPDRAQSELTQSLDRAAAALKRTDKRGEVSRRAAFTGPALHEASRVVEFRRSGGSAAPLVSGSTDAKVLAVSRGSQWPRAILGTMLVDDIQKLFVVVSREPGEPYKLFALTNMEPGASIPSLGSADEGAGLVAGPQGLVASPRQVAHRWAKAVRFPGPAEAEGVALDDAFSTALRTNAREEQKSLGDLARLQQHHLGLVGGSMAFRLKDGGAISLSGMRRRDIVETTSKARKLVLPTELRDLLGKPAVRERIEISTLETVAFIIPRDGQAQLIGAREQISSAWSR